MQATPNSDRVPQTGIVRAEPRRLGEVVRPPETPLRDIQHRLNAATADLDPPFAVADLDALDTTAAELVTRAAGKPIRVASKSVRCRDILRHVLGQPGWAGIMAYSLPEAIWLYEGGVSDDLLIGYPT